MCVCVVEVGGVGAKTRTYNRMLYIVTTVKHDKNTTLWVRVSLRRNASLSKFIPAFQHSSIVPNISVSCLGWTQFVT